jgi:hypothetical protein
MKRILPPLDFTPVLVRPSRQTARLKRDTVLAREIFEALPVGVSVRFQKKGTHVSTVYTKTADKTLFVERRGFSQHAQYLRLEADCRPGQPSVERHFVYLGADWMLRLEKLARKNLLAAHSDKVREEKKRNAVEIKRHFDLLQVSTNL